MEKTRKNLTSVTPASTILTFASFSSSSFRWTETREDSESEIIVFISLNRDIHGRVSCLSCNQLTLTKLTCYISHICCSDVLRVRTDLKRHSWTNNTIQIHKHTTTYFVIEESCWCPKTRNIPSVSVLTNTTNKHNKWHIESQTVIH